ncbi:hypothetical protein JTE90_000033, partial [Oedothorax gibbosus]
YGNAFLWKTSAQERNPECVPDKTDRYRTKGGFPILETSWASIMNRPATPGNQRSSRTNPRGTNPPFSQKFTPRPVRVHLALMGYERRRPSN